MKKLKNNPIAYLATAALALFMLMFVISLFIGDSYSKCRQELAKTGNLNTIELHTGEYQLTYRPYSCTMSIEEIKYLNKLGDKYNVIIVGFERYNK